MLTGDGAKDFAENHGITIENQITLQTIQSLEAFQVPTISQTPINDNISCENLAYLIESNLIIISFQAKKMIDNPRHI
jgi:hypothetical protein